MDRRVIGNLFQRIVQHLYPRRIQFFHLLLGNSLTRQQRKIQALHTLTVEIDLHSHFIVQKDFSIVDPGNDLIHSAVDQSVFNPFIRHRKRQLRHGLEQTILIQNKSHKMAV